MSSKINIFSDQWVDIVFQDKDTQLYGGAYDMRKSSSKRHAKATLFAVILFVVAILAPILVKEISALTKKDEDTTVRNLSVLKLDKPKVEPPKPLAPPPPPVRNQIKFVPPVIKKDEEVVEEPPQIVEKIIDNKAAISTVDVKGGTDDVAVPVENKPAEVEEIFAVVEQMPEFEGGEKALYAFINANIRYPAIALENGVQGRVIVRFAVNSSGHIEQVSVLRGIGGGCDEEAIRIVKRMPAWKPGKQGGRSVSVWYTLPIMFALAQ